MSAWLLHDGVQTRGWRLYIKMCKPQLAALHKNRRAPAPGHSYMLCAQK